jgi:hypothetical protein
MTVYQTDFRPAWVEPVPEPRVQIQRMMLATSMLVDGFVDTNPSRFQAYLLGTYLMPQAHLLITGTLCRRPLLLPEFAEVCRTAGLDGIIVRLQDERVSAVTFDLKQAGSDRMLCVYRLWMPRPNGPAWLIPSAGDGPFVRLDALGLDFVGEAPFLSEIDRFAGLQHGAEFISVAVQGWF